MNSHFVWVSGCLRLDLEFGPLGSCEAEGLRC